MKTPEELADEYAWKFYLHEDSGYAMTMNRDAFLAGFKAGVKEAEVRILDEFFNNYGADEHASFALRVNAYQWNDEAK